MEFSGTNLRTGNGGLGGRGGDIASHNNISGSNVTLNNNRPNDNTPTADKPRSLEFSGTNLRTGDGGLGGRGGDIASHNNISGPNVNINTNKPGNNTPATNKPSDPSLDELRHQLQLLVFLIAGTVPIYCAPCCYVRDRATEAFRPITLLVHDIMLHLALSGNVLRSLGVSPVLYDPNYMGSQKLIEEILSKLPVEKIVE